jgi:eukaryotic-like serine/threonine-protein kinase
VRGDDDAVSDLAGAVLDGTPIDWTAAESGADEARRGLLAELKVLFTLAETHRRFQGHDGTEWPDHAAGSPESLTHWGHLRILERIGRGAFGEVYRAWDTRLDREVALKLLDAPSAGANPSSSIIQEGRLLARVRHPNVVTVYGAEQIGPRIGLWMELVRGRTLKQIVDAGKIFSGPEATAIGIDLCHAVDAVHGAQVLHRDIKAQNVMLADDGRAVLMDFGTGREVADSSTSDLAGTPLYVAPEVLIGGDATIESDIYSVGVLLHHLVTGAFPVHGRDLAEVRRAHTNHERIPVRDAHRGSTLPPRLVAIVDRATDPQPERRYTSAAAMAADLSAVVRRPRFGRAAVLLAVTAVAVLSAALVWIAGGPRAGAAPTAAAAPVIAVLPFKNLSTEPESEYFVDGLTDEIIRNLAVIRGLQVRSRTSSFAFKDQPRNLQDVGEQLGANLVVEGSVLRSGGRLRINAQLVRVNDDVPLWSDRFDRELKDVFAIQDEISRAIVNQLRLTLDRGQRRYDIDMEAYELFLKGRDLLGRRGIPSLEQAAAVFEQVLARDPGFAPAYAGLANAYALMALPTSSTLAFEAAGRVLRPAATKARELDPMLADAHAAMGWVYARDRAWANAEKSFERAIELDSTLVQSYTGYSASTLQPLGKFDDALRVLHVALQHDPLSLEVQREIGLVHLYAGRYDEAIEVFQRIEAREPGFPFVTTQLGRALTFAGRVTEAIPILESGDGRHLGRFKVVRGRRSPWLALPYVITGRSAEAKRLVTEHGDSPANLVTIYSALGDQELSIRALERMATTQPHHVGRLLIYPELAELRSHPRVRALRAKFGLPTP